MRAKRPLVVLPAHLAEIPLAGRADVAIHFDIPFQGSVGTTVGDRMGVCLESGITVRGGGIGAGCDTCRP